MVARRDPAQRDRLPFLDRGSPGSWDGALAWADAQIVTGDKTIVYYGGYRSGHKVNPSTERQLGVATLRHDRYAGWAGNGTLRTKLLRLSGRTTVNAKAGPMVVRVRDAAGKLVRSCRVRGGDYVARPIPCAHGEVALELSYRGTMWAIGSR